MADAREDADWTRTAAILELMHNLQVKPGDRKPIGHFHLHRRMKSGNDGRIPGPPGSLRTIFVDRKWPKIPGA